MQDELQDRIVYGEHQIQYLENEILNEQRYRQRVRREEQKNHRKLMIFSALTIILGMGLAFFILWELFFQKMSPDLMLPISLLIVLPVMFFMAFFLAVCIYNLIKYGRRIHGDMDWKTFSYMTYDEMAVSSRAREKYLYQELLRTEVTHKTNRELLEARKLRPEPQEMKVISMEELKQIREEGADLPDEPVDVKNMGHLL